MHHASGSPSGEPTRAEVHRGRTGTLARGESEIDLFCTLLDHPLTGVRVSAVALLLASHTERAVATLRPIARGVGLPALEAQMTLERYEREDLELK